MRNLFGFIVLLFGACCLSSCLDDEPKDKSVEIQVTISSELTEKYGYSTGKPLLLGEYMQVKEGKSNTWESWHPLAIQGFEYKEGHEYVLKIKKTTLANPPADGSSILYTLLSVISDEKKIDIPLTERFRIVGYAASITGDTIPADKKKELEDKVLASFPQSFIGSRYKFVYTDEAETKGKAILYSGEKKTEGSFEKSELKKDNTSCPVYTISLEEQVLKYILVPHDKSIAFAEEVTEKYKNDYPEIETVYALNLIQEEIY
ncbi:DUF4377 domain-containing protein [Parabacteroides pacaensis]|uniref:DUF4377 domain-containing protein n=1 Tax=Parabacteroides pacaensis TaxID=2086575 RepID=UPI000D11098F|nr:DUF4377 domain-containing protein [Parabacteroides pacaensis]